MENFSGDCNVLDMLCNNIGKIVTVFTESGGESGCGFTGMLVCANCNIVKLITVPPTPPPTPFCCCKGRTANYWGTSYYGSRFGSVCVIPTCKIVCAVLPEV